MTIERTACQEVQDGLTDVLDGTAPASHFDHISACDACRDLRHEAASAAERVAQAGADFRAPADFSARLLAELDAARSGGAPQSDAAATTRTSAEVVRAPIDSDLATAATTFAPLANQEPVARFDTEPLVARAAPTPPSATEPESAPPVEPVLAFGASDAVAGVSGHAVSEPRPRSGTDPLPRPTPIVATPAPHLHAPPKAATPSAGGKVVALFRRPAFIAALAGTVATAAAAGFVLKGRFTGTTARANAPWTGKVTRVARASTDKNGGLESCDAKGACAPLAADGEIRSGWTLRTDARTRAYVSLSDGTELAMDRASTLQLSDGANRSARLTQGTVVLDVAHVDGASPAHVAFGHGDVEVLGTKLALTAYADRASLEVARGIVRLHDEAGRTVEVRAGEEAVLARGGQATVASSTSIADTMEWSDKSPEELDAPTLRGLGELRARKPGSTKEKDHAVRLDKHSVKVRVVDVVARTEVDETFANDTDEELEGIFRFPLPPGAQIEKLALEVDGKLMDGAFVDRERGAAIWRGVIQNAAPKAPKPREEIIWVPGPWRDPALLEWQRGGRFELKIFPIPKKGSRRVVLTYTQLVDQAAGIRRFTYPLAHDQSGTTKIDKFDLDLQVLGHDRAAGIQTRGYELTPAGSDGDAERRTMHADAFVPAGDLTVEFAMPDRDREVTAWAYEMDAPVVPVPPSSKPAAAPGARPKTPEEKAAADAASAMLNDTSGYVALALRPKLPRWQAAKERVHVLVVDASRSMVGERFARATRLASSIVREMDRRDSFVVLACDTTCTPMPTPQGGGSGAAAPGAAAASDVERFLGTIEPDGGSDLAASIHAAYAAAGSLGGKELRVIYLGDGTPTVGPTRPAHLEAAVRNALPTADGAVVAVALGADADTPSLLALARGGGGVLVPYVPGQRVASAAQGVLGAAYGVVLRDVEVELPSGLSQITPAKLDPIRAGGETFVFARMSGSEVSGSVKLRGRVESERFEQSYPVKVTASRNAGNAFVPRLFAAAKIAELERTGGETQKPTVIELSRRFAVASRFTSLLVLESEAMFNAFGLDRNSLAPAFTGETSAESSSADAEKEVDEIATAAEGKVRTKSGGDLALPNDAFDGAEEKSKDDKREASGHARGPAGGAGRGFGPSATATSMPSPAPAQPQAAAKPSAPMRESEDPFSSIDKSARRAPPATRPPAFDRPGRMIPMRRVFDRKASFEATNAFAQQNATKLITLEAALQATPDSRDKTLELFGLYATSGRLGEAQELTARWSGRDALDPDALLARADLAARQGDRDRAIRVLGGLADVRPGDRTAQLRLADLHEASGNTALACEHRMTVAELAPSDAKSLADAVRCARAQGLVDLAALLQADAPAKVREAADKLVAASPATALRGDVQISAEWTGAADLDVALVDAQGHRISWLGSPTKVGVVARDVMSTRTEQLGFSSLPAGNYVLEITRASGTEGTADAIRGQVTMRLVGETRTVPFVLTGPRAELGTVRVFFTSRLVPVNEPFGWR